MRYLFITLAFILTSLVAGAQSLPADKLVATVVFVNSDSLVNNYEYFKAVKLKLQDLSQKAQAEITAKGQAFQKEVATYQKSASSLTPMQKAATEKRLAKKQQDLEALNQNTSKQLQDESADQNSKLYDRISVYLKTYTKLKGYKIVLTYSKANPSMLYGDESLDVTKEVLAGLNDEYKKEAK
ncbi:MAG: OmpH family outer membrane protein [Mucilaginibacter sp.]|nr:OmpH family outer membrane protein [Mucilaginibacter sp.]